MSMSDFIEKSIENAVNSYFIGENIGGLQVSDLDFDVNELGDYSIYLYGEYSIDFKEVLNDYGVLSGVKEALNDIAYNMPDSNDSVRKEYIKKGVDEQWKVVQELEGEINEAVVEELYEQLIYAGHDVQAYVNNMEISSTVGDIEVDDFAIKDYINEVVGNGVSLTVFEQASIDLKNYNKDTLEEYIESY